MPGSKWRARTSQIHRSFNGFVGSTGPYFPSSIMYNWSVQSGINSYIHFLVCQKKDLLQERWTNVIRWRTNCSCFARNGIFCWSKYNIASGCYQTMLSFPSLEYGNMQENSFHIAGQYTLAVLNQDFYANSLLCQSFEES